MKVIERVALDRERHEALRRELDELLRRNAAARASYVELRNLRVLKEALARLTLMTESGHVAPAAKILGTGYHNPTLYSALCTGNVEDWVREFRRVMESSRLGPWPRASALFKSWGRSCER